MLPVSFSSSVPSTMDFKASVVFMGANNTFRVSVSGEIGEKLSPNFAIKHLTRTCSCQVSYAGVLPIASKDGRHITFYCICFVSNKRQYESTDISRLSNDERHILRFAQDFSSDKDKREGKPTYRQREHCIENYFDRSDCYFVREIDKDDTTPFGKLVEFENDILPARRKEGDPPTRKIQLRFERKKDRKKKDV